MQIYACMRSMRRLYDTSLLRSFLLKTDLRSKSMLILRTDACHMGQKLRSFFSKYFYNIMCKLTSNYMTSIHNCRNLNDKLHKYIIHATLGF